jgi:benzoyl-CoA reductase/2-hydroxyglutaryl-CoA dehydratase subunit BcrC/BadD/HgdB
MAEMRKDLKRVHEYHDRLTGVLKMLEGAPVEEQNPVQINVLKLMLDYNEHIIDAAENHKPLICTWYGNAQEIPAGMGIKMYNPVFDLMFHLDMTDYQDAKECDRFPLDDKICSLVRYAVYSVYNQLHPKPDCFLAMMEPCDAQIMLHQAFQANEEWKDVPCFAIDPSYGHTDEDFKYVAKQLKDMIAFLEKTTGAKYEFAKVRDLVEETNRQYEVWKEVNELKQARPCPIGSFIVDDVFWALTQHLPCGDSRATALMTAVRDMLKGAVAAGKGILEKEQIRILWPDLSPLWGQKLGKWLEEEWNAVVVISFQGHTPYEKVDTSTEESLLFGLARRAVFEVPMIRQGRGFVDVMIDDVTNLINDYSINCVIDGGHMGHKDQSGSKYFLRKICRDMDVPLLSLTTSLFDERYTSLDQLKKEISNFLSSAGFKRAKDM